MRNADMVPCKALNILVLHPNTMRKVGGVLIKAAFFEIESRSHSVALLALLVLKLRF